MKRSKIQSLQGVWAKQLQQLSGFAEYNHLCILMLNVPSYYKEDDIGLVTAES